MDYNKDEIRAKYKDLFKYSLDLIYVHDLKGNFLDANDIALKALGYKKEEITIISVINLIDNENLLKASNSLKELIKTGKQTERSEYKLRAKDGKFVYVKTYGIPLIKNGKIHAILGIANNITERKLAEQKLKESEVKYRHLFQNSPFFVGLMNLEGVLIDCNNNVNKFLSVHTREDVLKKNFKEIFSLTEKNKYIIPIYEKYIKNILNAEIQDPIEFKLYRSIGGFLWLNLNASIIKIEDETLIQVIIRDITEQKKTEKELRESEEKYRNVFENTGTATVILEEDTTISLANERFEKLSGYSKKEIEWKKSWTEFIFKEDLERMKKYHYERRKDADSAPKRYEFRFISKEGDIWEMLLTVDMIPNTKKSIASLLDITERRKAEFLVKEEIKKLKELDKLRKDLISRVSHEIKTPLASISGGAELILSVFKNEINNDVLELIELIERGGKRLNYLVDNLLDISRIEYDKLKLEKHVYDLGEIVRECSSEMMYLIKKRELILNLDLLDGLYLEIDKIRIEHVIMNLLSNAIKNTAPHGKITIHLQKIENWAEISITDTGIGLTENERDFLFTRFGKIERYGQGLEGIDIQGSGLGLFISKEIVDLHRGEIRAESAGRWKGSTFVVKLPIN
ncbi:MAG: sensor histidine kinase [Promethearchaeota archaeon]